MKVLNNEGEGRVPGALEHLIRLAEHGLHSVAFTVGRAPGGGRVEIWLGEVWHAEADGVVGPAALAWLLASPPTHLDAEALCTPPLRRTVPARSGSPRSPLSAPPEAAPPEAAPPEAAPPEAEAGPASPEADRQRRYDALVDFGLDALLASDLPMAWWAFDRAEAVVPHTRLVGVNLERLRQLGFEAQH